MTPLLRLEGISKRYGGVRALADARLECARGRIHAVLGENGAGKSTLIKVIAGVVKPDAATVFAVLRELREQGLAIVFISHRMHEIAELADDCSVYRNGCHVGTFTAGSKSPSEIIEMMIGRDVKSVFPPRPAQKSTQPPTLQVTNLSWAGRLKNIDFEVRPGEV